MSVSKIGKSINANLQRKLKSNAHIALRRSALHSTAAYRRAQAYLVGRRQSEQGSGEAASFCGTTLRPRSLKLLLTNKEMDLPGAVPFVNRLTDEHSIFARSFMTVAVGPSKLSTWCEVVAAV
jgi:hypothetical protein